MKPDINLIPPPALHRFYLLFIILILGLSIVFAIWLPIRQKNNLISEVRKINSQLEDIEQYDDENIGLEKHLAGLKIRLEILQVLRTSQNYISDILAIIDKTLTKNMEFTSISISKNTINIRGVAPGDEVIANSVYELMSDKSINSARIHEISLDSKGMGRIFHLECLSTYNEPDINSILTQE